MSTGWRGFAMVVWKKPAGETAAGREEAPDAGAVSGCVSRLEMSQWHWRLRPNMRLLREAHVSEHAGSGACKAGRRVCVPFVEAPRRRATGTRTWSASIRAKAVKAGKARRPLRPAWGARCHMRSGRRSAPDCGEDRGLRRLDPFVAFGEHLSDLRAGLGMSALARGRSRRASPRRSSVHAEHLATAVRVGAPTATATTWTCRRPSLRPGRLPPAAHATPRGTTRERTDPLPSGGLFRLDRRGHGLQCVALSGVLGWRLDGVFHFLDQ